MKKLLFLLLFSASIFLFNSCDTYADVPEPEELINNKITYKTDDWRTVSVRSSSCFNAKIISNTCNQGEGVIIFDDELTGIYYYNGGSDGGAFYNNDNLISIDLPETISEIGHYCFYDCERLATVYIRSTVPPRLGNAVFYFTSSDLRIYVPASSKTAYENASDWAEYKDRFVFTNY